MFDNNPFKSRFFGQPNPEPNPFPNIANTGSNEPFATPNPMSDNNPFIKKEETEEEGTSANTKIMSKALMAVLSYVLISGQEEHAKVALDIINRGAANRELKLDELTSEEQGIVAAYMMMLVFEQLSEAAKKGRNPFA